jgi:iron complex transport system substrate-binding protein
MEDSLLQGGENMKGFFLFACFLFPGLICSCTREAPKPAVAPGAFTDALGRSYAQSKKPGRIVSLSPAITEILFAIGAGEQVAGVTQYCDYPPAARTRERVGGFSGATVSVERIRALEPDLVILSADMHSRIVSLLDDLGIPSFAAEPRDFSQVFSFILAVGEITGCRAGAEEAVSEMKNKIAGVEERICGREKPGVFWILSEEPLMTAGGETFVSEAISLAGGRNIFGDLREQWPLVSPEQVLLRRPEWVLTGDDTDPSGIYARIPGTSVRAAVVNADTLYRYGPRLADAVDSISKILHP